VNLGSTWGQPAPPYHAVRTATCVRRSSDILSSYSARCGPVPVTTTTRSGYDRGDCPPLLLPPASARAAASYSCSACSNIRRLWPGRSCLPRHVWSFISRKQVLQCKE